MIFSPSLTVPTGVYNPKQKNIYIIPNAAGTKYEIDTKKHLRNVKIYPGDRIVISKPFDNSYGDISNYRMALSSNDLRRYKVNVPIDNIYVPQASCFSLSLNKYTNNDGEDVTLGYSGAIELFSCTVSKRACARYKDLTYTDFTTENTKIHGRTDPKDPFTFTWVNSGVEFDFTGTTIGFEATSPKPHPFFYELDGVAKKVELISGKFTYILENNLSNTKHTIKILRNYDVWEPDVTFHCAVTDKGTTITKTPDRNLKIQFIGDSLTAGASLESYSDAYPYIIADKLEADIQTFAAASAYLYDYLCNDSSRVSSHRELPHGIGFIAPHVYSGIDAVATKGKYVINDDFTFTFDSSDTSCDAYAPVGEYDYNSFVPDIIVINLGSNDTRFLSHQIANEKVEYNKRGFVQSYVNFLTTLGNLYPDAKIICSYGFISLDKTIMALITQAVEIYNNLPNHNETYTFTYTVKSDNASDGAHPGVKSHKTAADELSSFIKLINPTL